MLGALKPLLIIIPKAKLAYCACRDFPGFKLGGEAAHGSRIHEVIKNDVMVDLF